MSESPIGRNLRFLDNPSRRWWYELLNLFPFFFLPIVALVGILLAAIMPYVTGVSAR